MRLEKFVQVWNNGGAQLNTISTDGLEEFIQDIVESVERQFIRQEPEEPTIRMSAMGKPAVEIAYTHLMNIAFNKPKRRIAESFIFHFGDYYEALLLMLMCEYGVDVRNRQREVRYKNMVGHIDGTVGKRVIEVKTMAGYYFDRFVNEPDDDRGYITQLNLYLKSLEDEVSEACWLCFNKQTNMLELVELEPDDYYIERAEYIAKHVPKVQTFEDIQEYFDVPELIRNGHKKEVPPSMRYSDNLEVFYRFDEYGRPHSEAW